MDRFRPKPHSFSNLGLPLPASYGPESYVGHEAKTAIHSEAQVGPEGHMASWKRQKGHQQEVGCVPHQNSRKRLQKIGRESFCHGISRLLAVRLKPQYPRMPQTATAISGQKPTADLLLTFPCDIRVDKMLQPTTSVQYQSAEEHVFVGIWRGCGRLVTGCVLSGDPLQEAILPIAVSGGIGALRVRRPGDADRAPAETDWHARLVPEVSQEKRLNRRWRQVDPKVQLEPTD